MSSESELIRVRPLTSVLDGKNPWQIVHSLYEAGYDRFYVKVPEGFGFNIFPRDPFPPGFALIEQTQRRATRVASSLSRLQIRYVQLDKAQLSELLENPPIALHELSAGALASLSEEADGLPTMNLTYRQRVPGLLVPTTEAVANKIPTKFDPELQQAVVVKKADRHKMSHSYVLHGVTFKDIFVEEAAVAGALLRAQEFRPSRTPALEELPDDPYGLKESSPLVYQILLRAYRHRGKVRNEVDSLDLAREFKQLNPQYGEKNPLPFKNGRERFAANLANPAYKYTPKPAILTPPVPERQLIPRDTFLDQDFVNDESPRVS